MLAHEVFDGRRDILGTLLLAVLAGHRRYAHITALRSDAVNAALLGMGRMMSEDSVRRALAKDPRRGDHGQTAVWTPRRARWSAPRKPGWPSNACHTYAIAELRLMLEVEVPAGNQHASTHSAPGLCALLARIGLEAGARRLRLGTQANMSWAEREGLSYLFRCG